MRKILKYSALYFAIVFSVGFALGVIRVTFLVPALGESSAELIEIPFMMLVSYITARQIMGRAKERLSAADTVLMGVFALIFLLTVEFSLVLWLRGISISEYVQSKYSLAGIAYAVSLGLYAAFPWIVTRGRKEA